MCKAGLKPIDSSTHKSTLQVYREKLVITKPTFVHVNYMYPNLRMLNKTVFNLLYIALFVELRVSFRCKSVNGT